MKFLVILAILLVALASAQRQVPSRTAQSSRSRFNYAAFENTCGGFNGRVSSSCAANENPAMTEGGFSCCVVIATPPIVPEVPAVPKAPKGDYTQHCTYAGGNVVEGRTCAEGLEMVFQPIKVWWGILGREVCCRSTFDVAAFTNTCDGFSGRVRQTACSRSENAALTEGGHNCCVPKFDVQRFTLSCEQFQGYVANVECGASESTAMTESGHFCCIRPKADGTIYSEKRNNGRNNAAHRATIRKIQTVVAVPVDGIYGPVTTRHVRRFQQSYGLKVDGAAGPETIQAMMDNGLWPIDEPKQPQQPQQKPQHKPQQRPEELPQQDTFWV